MYIPSNSARERWVWTYSIFCVRLCIVCSFNSDGQYQSLYAWDEQPVRLSRFFFINPSIAKEEGPLVALPLCSYFAHSIPWDKAHSIPRKFTTTPAVYSVWFTTAGA